MGHLHFPNAVRRKIHEGKVSLYQKGKEHMGLKSRESLSCGKKREINVDLTGSSQQAASGQKDHYAYSSFGGTFG